jgi:FkbM family methyltransferase
VALLAEVAAFGYRVTESIVRHAGFRRSPLGRTLVAGMNRVGGSVLRRFTTIHRAPITVNGWKMYVAGQSAAGFAYTLNLLTNRYERGTTRIFERTLRPGAVVVDVGAHVGYYTLLAARLTSPEGKVYAFEPDPANFALLLENLELNQAANAVAIPKAVAEETSNARLFQDPLNSDRHTLCPLAAGEDSPHSISVPTTSLDEFCEALGWPRIDLIKMDIEGAEPMALRGMQRTLRRCAVRWLVVEFNPLGIEAAGMAPENFLMEVACAGYALSEILNDGELQRLVPADFVLYTRKVRGCGGTNLLCERVSAAG